MQNKQVFLQKHKKVTVLLAREAGTLGCGSTRLRGCHAANKTSKTNMHTCTAPIKTKTYNVTAVEGQSYAKLNVCFMAYN